MTFALEYAPLACVRLSHEYFSDGLLSGVTWSASAATRGVLEHAGLRFLREAGGFSLYYRVEPRTAANNPASIDADLRLVFLGTVTSPRLGSVSEIQIAPPTCAAYVLRQRASGTRLSQGEQIGAADCLPLVSRCFRLAQSVAAGSTVTVVDEHSRTLAERRIDAAISEIAFDLRSSFAGGVVVVKRDGQQIQRLFVDDDAAQARPAFVVELARLKPLSGSPIVYTAALAARSTTWRYHIVLSATPARPLRVTCPVLSPPYPADLTFAAREAPDVSQRFRDATVLSFRSSAPLPAREAPLHGIALRDSLENLLIKDMPNPGNDFLGADSQDPSTYVSDVYVRL